MIKTECFPKFDSKGDKVAYTPKLWKFKFFYENLQQTLTVFATDKKAAKKILLNSFPTATDIEIVSY